MKLFEEFAGVTMAEDPVGRQIVCRMHEMRLCGGCFSSAADSRFSVADDAVLKINKAGLKQRSERENDRGRVTTGIGHQASASYGIAMKLRTAVNSLGLQRSGEFRVGVFQTIDFAA